MIKDPICGMTVDEKQDRFNVKCDGEIYYFCSESCKDRFISIRSSRMKKKSWFTRFLEWIVLANQKKFGGKPPSCCS